MAKQWRFFQTGMPGNMNNLMMKTELERMQRQMEETTKNWREKRYTASSAEDAVAVTVSAKGSGCG